MGEVEVENDARTGHRRVRDAIDKRISTRIFPRLGSLPPSAHRPGQKNPITLSPSTGKSGGLPTPSGRDRRPFRSLALNRKKAWLRDALAAPLLRLPPPPPVRPLASSHLRPDRHTAHQRGEREGHEELSAEHLLWEARALGESWDGGGREKGEKEDGSKRV
jgi:hypothetical protein